MKKYASILLLLICGATFAFSDAHLSWKCTMTDSNGLIWSNESVYKRKASNTVFDACKNESVNPASCKIDAVNCDSFVNGIISTPLWQCMALDRNAAAWFGDISPGRDEAALNASAKCKRQSQIPATCYMHMLTCQNRNETQ